MEQRFQDRIAVVAGGSDGMGKQMAKDLAAEGAQVVIWARNEQRMANLVEEITAAGGRACWKKVNAKDYDEVQAALNEVLEQFGRVDIMICTVGGGRFVSVLDSTPDFWKEEFENNFVSVFNCFHTALKPMVKQQFGRLFYLSSTLGGIPGQGAYGMSKAACKSLIETIAAEHTRDWITANAILPGFVLTETNRRAFEGPGGEERLQKLLASRPLGCPNTVENVSRTALNILADARFTGQIVNLH